MEGIPKFVSEESMPRKTVQYNTIVGISDNSFSGSDNSSKQFPWIQLSNNMRRNPLIQIPYSFAGEVNFGAKSNGIRSARFSPAHNCFAVGLGSGDIHVCCLPIDDSSIEIKRNIAPKMSSITSVRFVPSVNNILLASELCGNIWICTTDRRCENLFATEKPNEINCIDINGTGTEVVSGGKDSVLRIYDVLTGKLLDIISKETRKTLEKEQKGLHRLRLHCVKFHPDVPQVFVSGGWDDYVKMWDIRDTRCCIQTFRGPYLYGDGLDFSGTIILSGSWRANNSLQMWDMLSGKLIDTIIPRNRLTTVDGEFIYCTKFLYPDKHSQDGPTILAGGNGTGALEIIDCSSKRVIAQFKTDNIILSIDSVPRNIIYAGLDNKCRCVEVMEEC